MTEAHVSWRVTGKEKFHKAVYKIYATGFRIFHSILLFQKKDPGDFPGGPSRKGSVLPMQGAGVQSLVRQLDPTRGN